MNHTASVQVNGASLHCTIRGNGPHPVLLIPGAAAPSHWSFSSQLEYLGRTGSQFTAIAYDPRGYGYSHQATRTFSIAVPEHHLKTDARDAHELMISLGYSKYSVLGWCDGGITAIHIAALFPEAVNGIVLWGSKGYLDKSDIEKVEGIRDIRKFNPKFKKAFEEVYGSEAALQELWDKYTDSVSATYYYHARKNSGEWCDEEMRRVSCKALIFHGAKDSFTTLSHARYINESIEDSELCIIQEGRHQLPDSLEINSIIEKFFNEC